MKIAIVSNVNIDSIVRILKQKTKADILDSSGYGNELGALINDYSALSKFSPNYIFSIIDTLELIGHKLDIEYVQATVEEWFSVFNNAINNNVIYYISDAYLYGVESTIANSPLLKWEIESIWNSKLDELIKDHSNIRVFPISRLIETHGEQNVFSAKMWYLGKIPYSVPFQKHICDEIQHRLFVETRTNKKVLLLDLDNTLWKGLAGENDNESIVLSDDGIGCAYKNFQRVLFEMKSQGVILGIVSKNNYADAISIINNHPHMVLRENDFSALRINWNNKAENIMQICKELNVGLDSVVFVDDNPAERQLIEEILPEATVPEFPEQPEDLPEFALSLFRNYFESSEVTDEDKNKTEQYKSNRERATLLKQSVSFDDYLDGLQIKLIRVNASEYFNRIKQLVNKTNQFNLTTKRYSEEELNIAIRDKNKEFFVYRVADRFGDNGIVIVAIVDYADCAIIEEFTMSCRIMGRNIENAVVEDIENAARQKGYLQIKGIYIPTAKNKPVKTLYSDLDYSVCFDDENRTEYILDLDKITKRNYKLKRQ